MKVSPFGLRKRRSFKRFCKPQPPIVPGTLRKIDNSLVEVLRLVALLPPEALHLPVKHDKGVADGFHILRKAADLRRIVLPGQSHGFKRTFKVENDIFDAAKYPLVRRSGDHLPEADHVRAFI